MGIVKVIVVAYERVIPLRILIDSFMVQTDDRWELHIIHDGTPSPEVKKIFNSYNNNPKITFYQSQERNQKYGHPNRKKLLEVIHVEADDFILITNDDNYYVPEFVRYCQNHMTKTIGLIWFNMLHNYYSYNVLDTKLHVNLIDMGSFIVRGTIAKTIGFVSERYDADGIYCMQCADFCRVHKFEMIKIPGILFIHN